MIRLLFYHETITQIIMLTHLVPSTNILSNTLTKPFIPLFLFLTSSQPNHDCACLYLHLKPNNADTLGSSPSKVCSHTCTNECKSFTQAVNSLTNLWLPFRCSVEANLSNFSFCSCRLRLCS